MTATIAALATPPGIGGIAVIRISGPAALAVAEKTVRTTVPVSKAKANTLHYGKIFKDGSIVDNIVVSIFKAPASYTGEDTAEISCHGGYATASEILSLIIENGAEYAAPGEFTRRAFINGKMDLAQVEAVADLIHSVSKPGAQAAARQLNGDFSSRLSEFRRQLLETAGLLELELDFAEEDLEFAGKEQIAQRINNAITYCRELSESYHSAEILRNGYFVAIAGYPNSGKSTLFNSLLKRNRAIVSEIPGTTRDYLEEKILINGISVRFADTAGVRDSIDTVEIEGIRMGAEILKEADMICIINDYSQGADNSAKLLEELSAEFPETELLMLHNKTDRAQNIPENHANSYFISAKYNLGIDELKDRIARSAVKSISAVNDVLINERHYRLLKQAELELEHAAEILDDDGGNELISFDIRKAAETLGGISGEKWSEEVLNAVFSRFCIGK